MKIALRYLFAKKSANVINIISLISMAGILVGTAALLIVLSVFNGLHGLIGSLFGAFDPQLKIESAEGKVFRCGDDMLKALQSAEGVAVTYRALEDNVLIKYDQRQMPATLLGVEPSFRHVTGIDSIMYEGVFAISNKASSNDSEDEDYDEIVPERNCVMGYILASQLGISPGQFRNDVTIFAPKRTAQINMVNPERSFIRQQTLLTGIFGVNQIEYDSKYAIVGLSQARELFDRVEGEISHIGILCDKEAKVAEVQKRLESILESYKDTPLVVKNQTEQHETFFKMMRIEKFMAYLILVFILAIAAFNIIGSLSMLIFEKKESVFILKAMGARQDVVTRVFLTEGLLISVGGAVLGLVLGILLTLAQQKFGIVGFGNAESYIVSAYPVALELFDVFVVFLTVIVVGFAAAWYPVRRSVAKYYDCVVK